MHTKAAGRSVPVTPHQQARPHEAYGKWLDTQVTTPHCLRCANYAKINGLGRIGQHAVSLGWHCLGVRARIAFSHWRARPAWQ